MRELVLSNQIFFVHFLEEGPTEKTNNKKKVKQVVYGDRVQAVQLGNTHRQSAVL